MLTKRPKGTKDILPQDISKWNFINEKITNICKKYGFKEIKTPVFEHTELFRKGVGDTTDIVQKEMYTFNDLGNRSITLRPEGTAPVVRAFVENKHYAQVQPTKYFYNIPCFRYERPQSGRLRMFHQFGVEVFGSNSMLADAEVIALANDFLLDLGIRDIVLKINSIGCPKCREEYKKALKEFLSNRYEELCDTCKGRYETNPLRILDCKSEVCSDLTKDSPVMLDYLCKECSSSFEELKNNLNFMNIPFEVDSSIVRGLDYYTKTAFEFVTTSIGAQGTVCGGGRYDNLIETIGGPEVPGVGFGLGIERLIMTLEAAGFEFPEDEAPDALIVILGDNAKGKSLELCHDLRKEDFNIEIDLLERNAKGQFKYADRIGSKNCIIIGDDEISNNQVNIKNMNTGEQKLISFEEVVSVLRSGNE